MEQRLSTCVWFLHFQDAHWIIDDDDLLPIRHIHFQSIRVLSSGWPLSTFTRLSYVLLYKLNGKHGEKKCEAMGDNDAKRESLYEFFNFLCRSRHRTSFAFQVFYVIFHENSFVFSNQSRSIYFSFECCFACRKFYWKNWKSHKQPRFFYHERRAEREMKKRVK